MNEDKGLGAYPNEDDNRDIPIAVVASVMGIDTTKHPKKRITDISHLPIEDQQDKGTCVGQAEGKGQEYREHIETGEVTRLSKRFIYTQCKLEDGSTSQGTQPRIAAKILAGKGTPKESLIPDNNDLAYSDYLSVQITPEILTEASGRRTKGYAFSYTLDELKTAIDNAGVLNASVQVGDWSTLPVKPLRTNGTHRGWHRILFFGYEDAQNNGIADTKIYFRNSWGKNWAKGKTTADKNLLKGGNGWFWYSEYESKFLRDMIAYVDMPNEIIDYAKQQLFIFTRQLEKGMTGTDVMELQKRLAKEAGNDGKPCFQYPEFTNYYGDQTVLAVQRYQAVKGIVASGTPATTGYGRVGRMTLDSLNQKPTSEPSGTMLEKWADAIQWFEGWSVGSKSYRNNNPGNIRYIGQKRAIGQDSTGFCIFATYADGRQELIDLLVRACTGKSSIYRPEMTLLEFYQKYAPSSDNNHPETYASQVAKRMGVSVNTKIKEFIVAKASVTPEKSMNKIVSSAAKIVFIAMALGAIAGLFTGHISQDNFMLLASGAFAFYFSNKGETSGETPYAGK